MEVDVLRVFKWDFKWERENDCSRAVGQSDRRLETPQSTGWEGLR